MDWDQIESKWAAMTRRVRADLSPDLSAPKATRLRGQARADMHPAALADVPSGLPIDTDRKLSTE